jgi:sarcosine oxidase subunit alpha
MTRLATGGAIDRARTLRFRFDGRDYQGHPGDTLASALIASGVRLIGRSFKYHRPRGIMAAGAEEANALVRLGEGDRAEPNLKATEIPLTDGLVATSVNCWPSPRIDLRGVNQFGAPLLIAGFYYKTFMWPNWHLFEGPIRRAAGLGIAPKGNDPDRYVHANAACDVLVVGGGPAGLAAAVEAARTGRSVILAEADFRLGGSALWRGDAAAETLATELAGLANVRILTRTNVFGYYDHNGLAATEQLDGAGPRQRVWKLRAGEVVLATGAIERPLVFEGNDRPGVMLASAAQAYAGRYGVLAGRNVTVFTNNDGAYEAACALQTAGAQVTLVDVRTAPDPQSVAALTAQGVTIKTGRRIVAAKGALGVRKVKLDDGTTLSCDLVGMSGGWSPVVHLFSQSGGKLRFDEAGQMFVPDQAVQNVRMVGGAAGDLGTLNLEPLWEVPGSGTKKFVDFGNDVTARDIAIAVDENYRSVEHLKRYTTLGMGVDQGKTSNVNGLAIMGALTGRAPGAVGTTRFRPPYTPVTLGALAGPGVGPLFRPIRYLPAYDWHVAKGALFEEHGPWLRPTAYPQGEETWEQAAQREARAARAVAALFDGSPLGKIEVAGPDAATFLDRIYVGNASNLKPGRARYGLMLNENGIIVDDGVFVRLADDRFLVHTTSGGADRIAAILEEWLQCEWVDLDVAVLPVTTQWATMTVSGPEARALIERIGTDIDLAAFPHMQFRTGTVAGLPARVLRASFTGEASYEISVAASEAGRLAAAISAAGAVPIGIEALMILRTEKGYLHVGVDTDGTTLPDDVGMAGPIAKKASDFIGRRSLLRSEAIRPDRLQLVGLASEDSRLPVGAHVLRDDAVPGPIDGHVTSSVDSPTLGHPVALALVRSGRVRLGETVMLYDMGRRYRATIVDPVFYDKAGERLNA